ncbi:MAG: phage holin family protein [Pseudonocardia sp.]|nr:phage holin family protein [Pseudonocardia sp.]
MQPDTSRSPDLGQATTGELVTRLSAQVSELVKGELELARAELADKGKRAGVGAGMMGAAGVLGAYGLAILFTAAIAALSLVWPVWLAALVIGIVVLVVAGIVALIGRSRLRRATPPVPENAVQSVREDVAAVREAARR